MPTRFILFFFYSLLLFLIGTSYFHCPLQYFTPLLIKSTSLLPTPRLFALALLLGTVNDLFTSYHHIGLFSTSTLIATIFLLKQKGWLFQDKLSTLSLLTFYFSFVQTLSLFILTLLFEEAPPLSLQWIATDLLFMPLIDSLYAFFFFSLPERELTSYFKRRSYR